MKILLCCTSGMSTSLLMCKMEEEAEKQGRADTIHAISEMDIFKVLEEEAYDVILIGPQIRFLIDEVKEQYPLIPIGIMDMMSYGICDGKKMLAQADSLINQKN